MNSAYDVKRVQRKKNPMSQEGGRDSFISPPPFFFDSNGDGFAGGLKSLLHRCGSAGASSFRRNAPGFKMRLRDD